jgi:hypothetical protein
VGEHEHRVGAAGQQSVDPRLEVRDDASVERRLDDVELRVRGADRRDRAVPERSSRTSTSSGGRVWPSSASSVGRASGQNRKWTITAPTRTPPPLPGRPRGNRPPRLRRWPPDVGDHRSPARSARPDRRTRGRRHDRGPEAPADETISEAAQEQFLHAFVELLREGLQGGSDQRELVMETAVPAIVSAGQTALDLVAGHVAFFTALSPPLLDAVPERLRTDAAAWLARYAADYTREVTERALAAEGSG